MQYSILETPFKLETKQILLYFLHNLGTRFTFSNFLITFWFDLIKI